MEILEPELTTISCLKKAFQAFICAYIYVYVLKKWDSATYNVLLKPYTAVFKQYTVGLGQHGVWDTGLPCSHKSAYSFLLPQNLITNNLLWTRSSTDNINGQHIFCMLYVLYTVFLK